MRQFVLLGALAVVACGDGDAARRSVEHDQQIAAAESRVKEELRDPASAEFSDVVIPHEGLSTVCGLVNSRNGFGGMAGPQRFIATADSVFLEEQQEAVIPGQFSGFWQQMCA